MKKYLFLFCLFVIYLILLINKKEQVESVFSSSGSYSPNIEMNIISNKDNLINFLDLNNYNYTMNFF